MNWPNWTRFSLRTLILCPLLFGSILALNHNWEPWYVERKLVGHAAEVRSAEFSSDGGKVITSSADGTAQIWDVASGKGSKLPLSNPAILAVFSPDNRHAAMILDRERAHHVVLFDIVQNKVVGNLLNEVGSVLKDWEGKTWGPFISSVAFSPDGRELLVASTNGVFVFDIEATPPKPRLEIKVPQFITHGAVYSPDSKSIALTGKDTIYVYDSRDGSIKASLNGIELSYSSTYSPDGTSILCLSYSGISQWNLQDLTTDYKEALYEDYWPSYSRTVQYSPNGKNILTAGGRLVRVRAVNGSTLFVLPHFYNVSSAKYSADGQRIVTASDDCIARVWRKTRPEEWWGVAWRPEFWLMLLFAAVLVWSLARDWRSGRPRLSVPENFSN